MREVWRDTGAPARLIPSVRTRRRPPLQRRVPVLIGAGLLRIWIVHAAVNEPALALSYFFLVPISLAAFAYGRGGAVLVAAASLVLFLLNESLFPSEELSGAALVIATASRALAFFGFGLLVAELLARQGRLTRTVADQERALEELDALREALTPPAVPNLPGLQVATAARSAEDQVAGDFFLAVPAAGRRRDRGHLGRRSVTGWVRRGGRPSCARS